MPLSKQRFFVGVVVWAGHLGRSSRRPARSCSALPDYRLLQSAAGGQERKSRPSPVPAALFVSSCTLRNGVNARPISLAFSQDGRWLATGDMISGTARRPSAEEVLLWDLRRGGKVQSSQLGGVVNRACRFLQRLQPCRRGRSSYGKAGPSRLVRRQQRKRLLDDRRTFRRDSRVGFLS